jgi:hypothetical protein
MACSFGSCTDVCLLLGYPTGSATFSCLVKVNSYRLNLDVQVIKQMKQNRMSMTGDCIHDRNKRTWKS